MIVKRKIFASFGFNIHRIEQIFLTHDPKTAKNHFRDQLKAKDVD